MRILILNYKHPAQEDAGGAELYMLRLAQVLLRGQHEVTFFTAAVPDACALDGVTGLRFLRFGTRYTVFGHAHRFLRKHPRDFDLVIDSVNHRSFAAHRIVGDRAIAIVHHLGRELWASEFAPPLSWFGRYVAEPYFIHELRGARLVAVSASTASDLRSVKLSVMALVPPAHDPPLVSRHGAPDLHKPRIVFVGRLVNNKRPLLALRAFQLLRTRYPYATMEFVGDGYLRAEIEGMRAPGVTVHGHVDDLAKSTILSRATLLLVPSVREGWGIVVSEAAAHGVPTIGTDIPGLRDSVVQNETGLLTADSPEAMCDAAVAVLGDPRRYAQMAAAAVERSRGMTWERCAREILALARKEGAVRCGVGGLALRAEPELEGSAKGGGEGL